MPVPYVDCRAAELLFRHGVIDMLRDEGLLGQERIDLLMSWQANTGFSLHNSVTVQPEDPLAVERLARYLLRPPLSVDRLTFDQEAPQVRYRRKRPSTPRQRSGPRASRRHAGRPSPTHRLIPPCPTSRHPLPASAPLYPQYGLEPRPGLTGAPRRPVRSAAGRELPRVGVEWALGRSSARHMPRSFGGSGRARAWFDDERRKESPTPPLRLDPTIPDFSDGCDIGSVEAEGVSIVGLVFGDDFESGDTSRCSAVVP